MAAINYDFSIEQGSYSTVTFVYQDANGNNLDLTGWCVIIQWKDNLGNIKVFSNREKTNNYDITTYSNGRIVFNLSANTTNSYNFDTAVYDLDIQEPNEQYAGSGYKTLRLATGIISIIKRANPQTLLTNCADLLSNQNDVCTIECLTSDIYAVTYRGNGFAIPDMGHNTDTISVNDNRIIEKVEVMIGGLRHKNPQDLQFLLSPPVGDPILLANNQKISYYVPGFNFILSDDALSDQYLHTIRSNQKCKIYNKTTSVTIDSINYPNVETSFSHLQNSSAQGDWILTIADSDPNESGTISFWNLIITYYP